MAERGFALLIVLWTLVLLALVTTRLAAGARTEAQLAANLRAAAAAEAAADGAVHEAMFRLLLGGGGGGGATGWEADGVVRPLVLPGGTALVRVEDEAGKVNPNSAPVDLLAALLRGLGADSRRAQALADAIADWRLPNASPRPMGAKAPQYRAAGRDYGPPEAPFRSLEELGLVLGMTPDLLARLLPHLTLFHEGDVEPGAAGPVVLQAIRDATGQTVAATAPRPRGVRTLAVTATATMRDGGRYTRRAVVRLGEGREGRPYRIFAWERVAE